MSEAEPSEVQLTIKRSCKKYGYLIIKDPKF